MMMVALIILGLFVAATSVTSVVVVRADRTGRRPFRDGYNSRYPQ